MEAFLAFLDHVHSLLTTTYHNTPIMLMASPQWTRPDCEAIAQYIFEKTRTPALCLIHSAIATQYGLKFPNMTIVDIGYEKVDVTAIHDGRVVNHMDIGAPNGDRVISGGEAFTQRLMKLLQPQNFTHDMAEQLKKSVICEVLPYAGAESLLVELPVEGAAPAAASIAEPVPDAPAEPKEAPKLSEMNGDEGEAGEGNGDDDGVLDVATIVTSGQTKEFLAKKEKEKGKPGRKPKDKEADAAQAKPGRLPNSKRVRNSFVFEEVVQEEVVVEPKKDVLAINGGALQQTLPAEGGEVKENPPLPAQPDAAPAEAAAAAAPEAANVTAPTEPSVEAAVEPTPEVKPETVQQPPAVVQAEPPQAETTEHRTKRVRRDIEVGLERFTFADREEIDRIVSTIYRTVQGIEDMYMRPPCWDNLVFVGNGSRLRGLKENILQTLNARHLVSPSTATMFTSELPSNMATPTGTGSQTPTGSFTGAPHQLSTSGVNPLLQAATTASTLGAAAAGGAAPPNSVTLATPQAGSETGGPVASHFHSQTPTSIKTASLPTYLQEWSKNGFEESMFLGAQVAARIVFCLHSNMDAQGVEAQRLASLSRVDYK
jgi:actin-related protein 9